ncbi:MAG: methylmalonyl-CoA mutase family protein [Crocinitomicaceae bacterium]
MSDFFNEFKKVSKSEWEDKIISDLKGKDPSIIAIDDKIEDLSLSSYYHSEDILKNDIPGNFPFTRGMNESRNEWKNGAFILVSNEKEANKKALLALNSGADLLVFKPEKEKVDWTVVINEIKFEFIHTQFVIESKSEFDDLYSILKPYTNNVQYNIDIVDSLLSVEDLNLIAEHFKIKQQRFCSVNGFKVQNIGANTWQEIAFCLNIGHDYLIRLMELGFTIDQASACISFNLGVGSNYFFETSKFRALKQLWAKVISAYKPEHNCSHNCDITAVIGHLNKSLKDPYTNLLRQTTEVMSAVTGGINAVVVKPYDIYSTNGASELSERMALNISNILKEESYFDAVIDPLGGSYSVECSTEEIARKAWVKFQELEQLDAGVKSKSFKNEITKKSDLRVKNIQEKSTLLIGINTFKNPEETNNEWTQMYTYLGLESLVLEQKINSETV